MQKTDYQMRLGHKHKGHLQLVSFYTFPIQVIEDKNHPKTIQCRQCIKACGHPDHQLNMKMFIIFLLGLYWPDTCR